jgi:hypothetical protein
MLVAISLCKRQKLRPVDLVAGPQRLYRAVTTQTQAQP